LQRAEPLLGPSRQKETETLRHRSFPDFSTYSKKRYTCSMDPPAMRQPWPRRRSWRRDDFPASDGRHGAIHRQRNRVADEMDGGIGVREVQAAPVPAAERPGIGPVPGLVLRAI